MIKYDIAALTNGRRGRTILNPIEERLGTVRTYTKLLRKLVRDLAAEVRIGIIPAYRVDRMFRDTDENTFQNIRALSIALTRTASATAERILRLEAIRHTDTFADEARKALGIDITSIVRQEDLDDYLRTAVTRNTSLIKSLSDDVVKRVEQTVLQNEIAGRSVKDLKKALVEQLGITDRRAQLIARDQTAKLNSDMNAIRQKQAGIDKYQWTTSQDERVRSLHVGISGREYRWGEQTGAEGGLPPGQPIQCRCTARGIVEFDKPLKNVAPAPVQTMPPVPRATPGVSIDPVAAITAARIAKRVLTTPAKTVATKRSTAVIVAEAEAAAKTHVVTNGLKTKKEYLTAIDAATGETVDQMTSGKKNFVAISPALLSVIRDETRQIIVHHNHPGSSSFSPQDLSLLYRFKGTKGIWAHGHNGSSYYAERGSVAYSDWQYKSLDKTLKALVTAKLDNLPPSGAAPGQHELNKRKYEDWNAVYYHVIAAALDAKKIIKYRAELKGASKWAAKRLQSEITDLIGKLK